MRLKRHGGRCCDCSDVAPEAPCQCQSCSGPIRLPFDVPNLAGWETYAAAPTELDGITPSPILLQCRYRGGPAEMVGYDEYTTPSSPPKYYRRQTLAGGWCNDDFYAETGNHDRQTYGGSYDYDRMTGVATNSQVSSYGIEVATPTPCAAVSISPLSEGPERDFTPSILSSDVTLVTTRTTKTWTYGGNPSDIGSGVTRVTTGVVSATLSVEDLESDAIARLLASGSGSVWTAWVTLGDGTSGPVCAREDCCRAHYYNRTGRSFGYQEAQWRASPTGQPLVPGCYAIRVAYLRRPAGSSGAWSEVGYDRVYVLVGATGSAVMHKLE